nr:phage tail protein [uncultured Anaerosporobacter sp.]
MSSISNITIHFDKLNQVEIPEVMICHKSKHRIGYLNCVENLKLRYFLNDMDTCDFKIPRMINGKKNRYYDYVDTKMNLLVVGYGWFTITSCTITSTGGAEYKIVSAKGLEYELTAQQGYDLEINSGDIDYDNYTPIKFYNPNNKDASLLHIVLDQFPNWSIGHVDIELEEMQRSFDVDEQNVYAFLTGDVAEAFECFFIFDGYHRTVNAFKIDEYGKDTRIMLNFNNLCQEVNVDYDDSSIITEYRIIGEEGINIADVNPTGTNVISNYSYFLDTRYMSQETIDCYNNFQQVYSENIDKYNELLLQAKEVLDVIAELQQRLPDDLESTDWTKYGLVMLQTKQEMLNNTLNDFIAEGWGYATSEFYTQKYLPTYELLMSLESEMKVRENEIAFQQQIQKTYQEQIKDIQNLLNERNYYTEQAWLEKCSFGFKQTYTNDNYITTELDTDAEIMATEKALYEMAVKELADVCKPNMSFSATIDNIFHVQGFSKLFEEFELGNYVYVEINENYFIKVRLISYSINFDNPSESECEFSDLIDVSGKMSSLQDILAQTSSTVSSTLSSKKKWDYAVNEATTIYKIRKECLDLALYTITNADNQEFTIDNRGITGRHLNDESLDYDDEQVRITHNLMAYTNDNWKSVRSAFGKIWVNGEWQYGLIADALISKILMGALSLD